MRKSVDSCKEQVVENVVGDPNRLKQVTQDLCEKALADAKNELHPLLYDAALEGLDQRCEFLQAFKRALEEGIARQLTKWQPCVQAVYKFDAPRTASADCWDNTIHILVKVPQLLDAIKFLGASLDRNILRQLKKLGWPRFQASKSVIEVQQVTLEELRHHVSYGAMFLSLYAAPVKVWPPARREKH